MEAHLDLGDGWQLVVLPDGPAIRAPNGETGPILGGDVPMPGWYETVEAALEQLDPEGQAGLALARTLEAWLRETGEAWECGCGRDNPVSLSTCILCGTPRGAKFEPPDLRNPRDVWREGIVALRARYPGSWGTRLPAFERVTAADVDELLRQLEAALNAGGYGERRHMAVQQVRADQPGPGRGVPQLQDPWAADELRSDAESAPSRGTVETAGGEATEEGLNG